MIRTMLPKVIRNHRNAPKVRIFADNSVVVRGNVTQVYPSVTWR